MKITWTTAKGANVEITMDEATTINADGHKVTATDGKMNIKINGSRYPFSRAEVDPEHGYCLKIGPMGKLTLPVAADKTDDVAAMVAEHERRVNAYIDAVAQHDTEQAKMEARR